MPLLSVIIPVYNAADYISTSIKSVLNQKMEDYELILVNDGSTDNSLEILNTFAKTDNRIRICNIENSGPAIARNKGIEISSGKYIAFLDSDDVYTQDAFEVINNICESKEFDLLIFGFTLVDNTTKKTYLHYCDDLQINDRSDLNQCFGYLYKNNQLNQVWNKVYLSQIIKDYGIRFPDYMYGEDRLFVFEVLLHCKKVSVNRKCLYNYYMQNKNSLISKYYSEKFKVCNLIDDKICDIKHYIGDFSQETASDINYMYLKGLISCITNLYHTTCNINYKEKKEIIRNMLSHNKVQNALLNYTTCGVYMDIIISVLKTQNVLLISILARFISYISQNFVTIFLKLKHPFSVDIKSEELGSQKKKESVM